MRTATLLFLLLVVGVSACKPKAPEKPNRPPTPNTAVVAPDSERRPTLTTHIAAGGKRTQYSAYFDGQQLTEIKERADPASGAISEYHYRGARLLKYTHAEPTREATLIELDDQGRVQRAVAGTRALAVAEIDAIRTHAQLLRSHALAQQASRMHLQ
ncbi:MAG: hypothetical protein ABW110_00465 [Steroidobacteraceae bacterium]